MLRYLFTGISLRRPRWVGPLVRTIAPTAFKRLAQHHSHEAFEESELRVLPSHVLVRRLGERAWNWSQRRFGRLAGEYGVRDGCGVMAFNTNALETFRMLKAAGLPCLLDQTIAHRRWSDRVGQAECDAYPDWGDKWAAPTWRVEMEDEEIALADMVLCGSRFCAETLETEGVDPQKIAVVEYGADTSRFTPLLKPRQEDGVVRILFVGTLALRKGIRDLLEAGRRLAPLGVRITAVGSRCVRAEALGRYEDILEVTGHVLHESMPAVFRRHDIYVFPSLVEGSSLSIYEALASGLPVVTTANAGSIVRNGIEGFVVPPRDLEALCAAVERLVKDRDLRLAMGMAARRRAEAYGDWNHYGDRLAKAVQRFV